MVVGTDIAELLIKNQSEFPYDVQTISGLNKRKNSLQSESHQSRQSRQSMIRENQPQSGDEELSPVDSPIETTEDKLTEDEVVEKFRSYLLYGNVNEALDWATDNNLWGHALFLASKVDRRSHANVMMKFANKIALNDPLQTLFQLMSGRIPSSVTVRVFVKRLTRMIFKLKFYLLSECSR